MYHYVNAENTSLCGKTITPKVNKNKNKKSKSCLKCMKAMAKEYRKLQRENLIMEETLNNIVSANNEGQRRIQKESLL